VQTPGYEIAKLVQAGTHSSVALVSRIPPRSSMTVQPRRRTSMTSSGLGLLRNSQSVTTNSIRAFRTHLRESGANAPLLSAIPRPAGSSSSRRSARRLAPAFVSFLFICSRAVCGSSHAGRLHF
jgi:hypothetical protein